MQAARDHPPPQRDSDGPHRVSLLILATYLTVMLTPLLALVVRTRQWTPFIAHAFVLALVALALSGRFPPWLRAWLPLLVGPFLYVELRWLIEGAGRTHTDELMRDWERSLFPSNPSRTLALSWPSSWVSEPLHAAYLSYYGLVYVPPALLWLKGRRRDFSLTLLALTTVYAACFVAYVLMPVDGPRFLFGPSQAPSGPFRSAALRLLEAGSSRGTAFPSSHVAASVVAAICALRFQPRIGAVTLLLALGVAIGAVYGGFHYAVDVVAGFAAGLLCVAGTWAVERRLAAS